MIVVEWPKPGPVHQGRVRGYVTNGHGQVCAIVQEGQDLVHVPLRDVTVVEDKHRHRRPKLATTQDPPAVA